MCICNFLCDANPAIIKDQSVPKWRRYLIIVLMFLVGILALIAFIINVVYFKRINPYYKYGKKSKMVWLFSLIAFVVFLLCFLFFVLFALIGILKNKGTCCFFFFFNAFAWIGLVVGIITYVLGTESTKVYEGGKRIINPCSAALNDTHFACMYNIQDYEEKLKCYEWWKNLDTKKICEDVVGPALYVEIIQYIFYILLLSFMTGCCCCKYKGESEDENDDVDNVEAPNQNDKDL